MNQRLAKDLRRYGDFMGMSPKGIRVMEDAIARAPAIDREKIRRYLQRAVEAGKASKVAAEAWEMVIRAMKLYGRKNAEDLRAARAREAQRSMVATAAELEPQLRVAGDAFAKAVAKVAEHPAVASGEVKLLIERGSFANAPAPPLSLEALLALRRAGR